MKKNRKKLTLNRDTVQLLSGPALEAAGGIPGSKVGCTIQVSCAGTCAGQGTCVTCTCPTLCGQWYC